MTYVNKGLISPRYIVSSLGDGNYDDVDGTSDEDQINQAINDLTPNRTWPEMVLLKGNLVINGPIVVPAYTHIVNTGRVYLDDSSNCNMLENANPASNDIHCTIEGGIWYGNRDNNTSGDIIYWEHSTPPASNDFKWTFFRDMTLVDADDVGLHIDSNGSSESNWDIRGVKGRFADSYSFHFHDCADMFMYDCQTEGNAGSLFDGCGIGHVEEVYFNQGAQFVGCAMMTVSDCNVDMGQNLDGISLSNTRDSVFDNLMIRYAGSSGFVNNSAVYLSTSDRNMFRGIRAGRFTGSGTNRWNYIIEEGSGCDENMYKDIHPDDYVTAAALIQDETAKLDFLSVPFTRGRGGATETDYGIDVSGAGEHAVANVNLPHSVHQIVWLVIDGYINAAPGAGDTMEIDLRIRGGADNQPALTTHSTTIANLGSTGVAYTVGDVGFWRISGNDYAGVLALTGGDAVQIDVYHEVGSGEEASTNADLRSATIWYV